MAEQQTAVNHPEHSGHDHDHAHGEGCGIPSFHTRDLIVREDIMNKAKEMADLIFTSAEVQHYRRAEQQINGNERVQKLISQIKKKQKEVVAFETTFKNADMVKKIESEMNELQDELDGIPIVAEFQQSQADINYLMQLVVTIVRDTVSDKINVEDASEPAPEECSD
ncbi:RicAFT regulatory complex protein RicA family protein [Paenibacillus arenilitoris]|uniref:RicAFT regulatory complex protein RicA family protein n=1 Tax=Paenibacillus arenilitoris TaxID=2772299 RepID=A0A927CN75_9BACL|nr:YlbF family regulator [Paenibacillus arenilitoris]MBD2870654.1 RicAFT regulatory complex protein RicA family protein [Paenibacillus arenilitoris]